MARDSGPRLVKGWQSRARKPAGPRYHRSPRGTMPTRGGGLRDRSGRLVPAPRLFLLCGTGTRWIRLVRLKIGDAFGEAAWAIRRPLLGGPPSSIRINSFSQLLHGSQAINSLCKRIQRCI